MKTFILICVLVLTSCGYMSKDNQVTGQVKRLVKQTPIICPDRTDVDISLGIMRNGTGSVSKEDLWLTVRTEEQEKALAQAAKDGTPIELTYDIKRWTWCSEAHLVSEVKFLKGEKQ